MHRVYFRIALLFLALTCAAPPPVHATRPASLRVVMDNNYPPYVFQDSTGKLQGILIDQWRLWEQKNGIPVTVSALDWNQALRGMKAGEFDVIDTIFKTEERSQWLDFSEPYARLEVPIFFHKEISGISDAASLKGFAVAVKAGDAAIDLLKHSGVENLLLFNSYEAVILAAKEHKATVFVVDKPPALYFLHKFGIEDYFKQSTPLNVGEFHRAVRKGNLELLNIVVDGFRRISPGELKKIETRWHGSPLGVNFPTVPFLAGFGGLCLLVLALFVWNRTLKGSVAKRTAELQSAEKTLRESEEKFKAIFEQGYYLAGLMDLDGTLTDVNNTALQFSDVKKEDVIGKPFWDTPWWAHSPELQEKLRLAVKRAAGGELVTLEATHPETDGTLHYIDFSLRPVKDQAGAVIFLVPEGRDITARRKAEEERLELERQLLHAQKLESLGVLSGGIAHDFNNLLQALLGNLELALIQLPPQTSVRNYINHAIKAARNAAKLTNMMLAYSGKGLFVVKELNLSELVEENATMLEAAIPRSIILEQHLDHALPDIKADAGQLQQVIMNLITNAAEAIGDRNGTIRLSTGVGEFDQDTLAGSRIEEKAAAGHYVWMKVCDNGCGMGEETLKKLFDPFFTTKFTGRGLGMSAVLGIIRAHKGAFLVESRPDAGTTIQVLFPLAGNQAPEADQATDGKRHPEKRAGHPVKILVVDDEDMVRAISTAMLEELGFETISAASGEEALTIFHREGDRIGLVLLDQVMPGMDGVSVFREMRALRPEIKILLASGFSQQEVSERFNGLGLNGFIAKPYTLENLSAELSCVLNERG